MLILLFSKDKRLTLTSYDFFKIFKAYEKNKVRE